MNIISKLISCLEEEKVIPVSKQTWNLFKFNHFRNRIKLNYVDKINMNEFAQAIIELIEVIKTIKATCINNI